MAANKKLVSTIAAVATSAALLLGGTLAWQSANQTALNEASDVVNPGGRLHDDFYIDDNGDYNADIYVENFADDQIFARVKLQEYMEVVLNYNTAGEKLVNIVGSKSLNGAEVTDEPTDNTSGYEYEYITHDSYAPSTGYEEIAGVDQTEGTEYWTWTMGSPDSAEVYYMPTFNMNKDSLVADRNGMYVDRIGGISNRGQAQYDDWTVWTDGAEEPGTEIWDADYNDADEVGYNFESLDQFVADGNIETVGNTHTAQPVGTTNGFISMSEWMNMLSDDDGDGKPDYDPALHGNYWVYDEDGSGWIYWSSPIKGKSATGLLLDSIDLNDVMDDTWYYAINAIGQFVTADDVGKTDGTGFYGVEEENPSESAEILLEAIGVQYGEGDETDDPEEEQVYTMHLYLSGSNYANYLVPGTPYTLEIAAEENEYNDTSVALTVMDENGKALTPGKDYELGNASPMFGPFTGSFGGDYAHSATTTLKILNENLVGTTVTIEAVANQTGNTGTIEVSVNYDQLEVNIQLYDADGNLVAGTGNGSTIKPNSTYDIVGTITGADGTEYVIYSTLNSKPVSANIEVPKVDVVAHAGDYHEINYINESGQLVVGSSETFDCTDFMDDEITNLDALTLVVGADIVRVYESVDSIQNGAEPKEIYYTYGQWDLYPTGQEKYEVSISDITVSQSSRTEYLLVMDGNDRNISDKAGLTVTVSGNNDAAGTKLEFIPATEESSASYRLTIGENETATKLTITASDSNGSGSCTINVNYLNTLKIGDSASDQWNYVYINSSDTVTTAELSLADYWGNAIDNVTYALTDGNTSNDTRVDGSTLHIGAEEQGYPMTLTANGVEYSVYVNYIPDETAPTVEITYNDNPGKVNVSLSGVSDGDFPLTLKAYAQTDEGGTIAEAPYNTITINLAEDGPVSENTNLENMSYAAENGSLTLTYLAVSDGLTCYKDYGNGMSTYYGLKLAVADAAGNEYEMTEAFTWMEGGCFAAGTKVLTEDGLKNIEDITLGELVWSVNMETYQSELKPVTYVQGERYTPATYTIHVGGEKIVTTYEHPFYANGKWTAAEDLKAGDMLRRMDGTEVAIDKVVYTELAEPLRVYNFTVDENHCYIVSAQELLVHNIQK